nr:exopolygalacturonase clone GBGE184-like [Ipomoea batatas]
MAIKVGLLLFLVCTTLIPIGRGLAETVIDVTKFGAKPNGKVDSTMGPCTASKRMTVEIQGTLIADNDISAYTSFYWIMFEHVDNVVVTGGGTINGRGEAVWKFDAGEKIQNAPLLPVSLVFQGVRNSALHHLNFVNSKGFHLKITDSSGINVSHLRITAPGNSPNTDGIHISETTNIKVTNSVIQTGDDCVSIGDGNNNVIVSGIKCGPGHGISIGSIGKRPDEKSVKGVRVSNCTLTGTTNGARIKTYRASPKLQVSSIIFENLILKNVKRPIIIDQDYNSKNKIQPSNVKIRDVHFKNIRGTISSSKNAVMLTCSESNPCQGIEFANIDIRPSSSARGLLPTSCVNVKPIFKGKAEPNEETKHEHVSIITNVSSWIVDQQRAMLDHILNITITLQFRARN